MKNKKLNYLFIILSFFLSTRTVSAMNIYVEMEKDLHASDVVMAKIMLDTDKEEINALEGEIVIEGNYEPIKLTTTGSIFNLWPNKPSISKQNIYFVGGTNSGTFGNHLRIFNIYLKPLSEGKLVLTFKNTKVFLNDGNATKKEIAKSSQTVVVQSKREISVNELGTSINEDRKSPTSFSIELGQGLPGQEQKYFLSFFTTDNESDINRYEVTEGTFPAVRSGNTYILQDQSLKSTIKIKAIDNAGNEHTETFSPQSKKISPFFWIIIVFLIIIKVIFIYKKKN